MPRHSRNAADNWERKNPFPGMIYQRNIMGSRDRWGVREDWILKMMSFTLQENVNDKVLFVCFVPLLCVKSEDFFLWIDLETLKGVSEFPEIIYKIWCVDEHMRFSRVCFIRFSKGLWSQNKNKNCFSRREKFSRIFPMSIIQ